MPYPLEMLQYGLRRRLRQLATPAETCSLQIAAPNFSGLQPIQKFRHGFNATIQEENNQLWILFGFRRIKLSPYDQVYNVTGTLTMRYLKPSHINTISTHFLLKPTSISFHNCILDLSCIRNFCVQLKNQVNDLIIDGCTITSEHVPKSICMSPAFKTLQQVFLYEASSLRSWIEAFTEMKYRALTEFHVRDPFLSAFDFDSDTFLKFIKSQNSEFKFYIRTYNEAAHANTKKRLEYLLGKHFQSVNGIVLIFEFYSGNWR